MKDSSEGGSRDAVSAQKQPAQVTGGSEPSLQRAETPMQGAAETDEEGSHKPISADMQQFIGRQLRAVFDDVAKQPVPDRFLELMKQLDDKTGGR